ncbi:MAG: hypothetical protein HQ521_20115 [Bacteroidetes bacterium]|nr:hypothetical protein [Bacteroidota bacterium]
MVKIIDYKECKNSDGLPFYSLIVQGEIVMAQSQETGLFYATSKNASITTTFDGNTCKGLIGREISGKVEKLACEPYEYTIPETGEIKTLYHRWIYLPEVKTEEQVVYEGTVQEPIEN